MEDSDNGMSREKEGDHIMDTLGIDGSQDSRGQEVVNDNLEEQIDKQPSNKCKGLTKMKTIVIDEHNKMDITYNEYEQSIGRTSVGLTSFLGTLL